MRQRAEAQERTRLRITESAVALHGTVGPARTTVSAVADHAGVRRSTVYRHFPDEAALFDACSAHWAAANPPPDIGAWNAIAAPDERLRTGLAELYAYYRRTASMLENLLRDEDSVPVLKERFAGFRAFLQAAGEILLAGAPQGARARRRTQAAIGHALAFTTWRSLAAEQGLSDDEAAELMSAFVAGAGASRSPRERGRGRG